MASQLSSRASIYLFSWLCAECPLSPTVSHVPVLLRSSLSAYPTSSNEFPRVLVTPRTELILSQPRPLLTSSTSPDSSRAVPTRPDLFRSQLNQTRLGAAINRRQIGFSPSGADDVHDSHTVPPIPGLAHDCSASCRLALVLIGHGQLPALSCITVSVALSRSGGHRLVAKRMPLFHCPFGAKSVMCSGLFYSHCLLLLFSL